MEESRTLRRRLYELYSDYAMPSATALTRPTCSVEGANVVALTRFLASLSQRSKFVWVSVTIQLLADSIEIRAPTVAHDRVGAAKLNAGNQRWINAEPEGQL